MIITEKTKWVTEYELDNDWVNMTISFCNKGKVERKFYYIIPIEFYDDVRIWDWQVIIGKNYTPIISYEHYKMIKQLTNANIEKGRILSLNMITPFMTLFKHKTVVSNKNDSSYCDNHKKSLWYDAGYEDNEDDVQADEQWEQACRSFDIYVERALQEK